MSKSNWITTTPCLLEGVQLINEVDDKKFSLVLNRIAQCLQYTSDSICPFTEDEEEKLLSTLTGVETKNNLKTILDISTYVLAQAAYNVTKPAILRNDLMELLKMNEIKANIFFNTWTNTAKGIVESLRQKSIHDVQLEGLQWMLNVSTASNKTQEMPEPKAIIELKLKQDDDRAGNLLLDMNQTQLYELYNTLENIQSELDKFR